MDTSMSPADYAVVSGANRNGWGADSLFYIVLLFLAFAFMGGNWSNAPAPAPQPQNYATQAQVQEGFNNQATMRNFDNVTNLAYNGFGTAEVSRANNTNQIINGMTNFAYATQQGIAQVNNNISMQGEQNRNAMSEFLYRIQMNTNQKVQEIKDQMCQDKIEQKNDTIAQLRQELNEANRLASQTAQTGQIIADNNLQTQNLVSQLKTPAPIPAYTVPNPSGCNCGNFANGCCA